MARIRRMFPAWWLTALPATFFMILPDAAAAGEARRASCWRGSLEGEFIGDTSRAEAARMLVPSLRIGFKIRISGMSSQSGEFSGSYDAFFRPEIRTFDVSRASEVEEWIVKAEDSLEACGSVTGSVGVLLDENQKAFIRNMLKALAYALEKWKAKPLVSQGSLNGAIGKLAPGSLKGDIDAADLFKQVMEAAAGDSGSSAEDFANASNGLAKVVNDFLNAYQADLLFPAAQTWSGPFCPSTPNIPVPFATGASSSPVSKQKLSEAFAAGGKTNFTLECLAEVAAGAFTAFTASNAISNVSGSGPVPSFAPGASAPAGPVAGGNITGGRLAGPPLSEETVEKILTKMTSMVLVFEGMPQVIQVHIGETVKNPDGPSLVFSGKRGLGIGYFSPGALIYRTEFGGPLGKERNLVVCVADIDDEKDKPSPLGDGTLREIAKSRLSIKEWDQGSELPADVRKKLALDENGIPPLNPDGTYKSPSGRDFDGFAVVSDLARGGGNGSGMPAAGLHTVEAASTRGEDGREYTVLFFNGTASASRPAGTGLFSLVESEAPITIRPVPAVKGAAAPEAAPAVFRIDEGKMRRNLVAGASGFEISVPPSERPVSVSVVIPKSAWTRRAYRIEVPAGGAELLITVSRAGKLTATGASGISVFEDWDGKYRGKKKEPEKGIVSTARKPKPEDAKPETPAPTKPEAEPGRNPAQPPENKDPEPPKDLPLDRYCEMAGKVVIAVAPLVVEMKKALTGLEMRDRVRVGNEYKNKIDSAMEAIYKEFGVTKEWADQASKRGDYKKAFGAYALEHPDVMKAIESMSNPR